MLGPAFASHKSVAYEKVSGSRSSQDGRLWTRLVRAAGKPGAAFERLIEDFNPVLDQDSATRQSIEERKILLKIQLQNVRVQRYG